MFLMILKIVKIIDIQFQNPNDLPRFYLKYINKNINLFHDDSGVSSLARTLTCSHEEANKVLLVLKNKIYQILFGLHNALILAKQKQLYDVRRWSIK
jgi:hypothetical protein